MMKRTFKSAAACAGALMMLCGSAFAAIPASAADAPRLMGDLNGDMNITLADALGTLQIYSNALYGAGSNAADMSNYTADIDMNGTLDLSDALSILQYYSTSLLGGDILWADLRKTSYHDGSVQKAIAVEAEDPDNPWQEFTGSPFELKDLYVEFGCAEGKPGEEVVIPVYVAGCGSLCCFQFVIDVPEGTEVTNLTTPLPIGYCDDPEDSETYGQPYNFCWNPEFNVGGRNCTMLWVNTDGYNYDISDGALIAEITYKIPEDAKSGDYYILSDDSNITGFSRCATEEEMHQNQDSLLYTPSSILDFQYTLIDGVIRVK